MAPVVLRVDPSLAEALAWRALARLEAGGEPGPLAGHHRRAAPLYELGEGPARDAAFRRLAEREVLELGVLGPVEAAFTECAELVERIEQLLVGEAAGPSQEGAMCDRSGRRVGLRALLHRFDDPGRLRAWARHAFAHAADTLDSAFAYEPGWDEGTAGAGPIAERLHLLWDISIDGRARRAWPADPVVADATRARHEAALVRLFPGTSAAAVGAIVERLWSGDRPSFPEFRAWASEPERLGSEAIAADGRLSPGRCPLCSFPSHDLTVPDPAVAADVAREYPRWRPSQGLCARCLDRYAFARIGGPS